MSDRNYRDYLVQVPEPLQQGKSDSALTAGNSGQGFVIIMPDRAAVEWTAVWHGDASDAPRGTFCGRRADAIAWARRRSSHCSIYSVVAGDLIPLADDLR